jgi:hypothetical protein
MLPSVDKGVRLEYSLYYGDGSAYGKDTQISYIEVSSAEE